MVTDSRLTINFFRQKVGQSGRPLFTERDFNAKYKNQLFMCAIEELSNYKYCESSQEKYCEDSGGGGCGGRGSEEFPE